MKWSYGLVMAALASAPAAAEEITYSKHIAPILMKHCAGCHRPGEVGPFALLSHQDAAKRADFIKKVTANRRMPPWKAEPGELKFLGERRLSDDELSLIARWADSGAKEGDAKDLPPAPKFTEGWQLGQPDLVLKMPEPFTVPAGGRDVLQCFTIPIPLDANQTISAFEFRPGNRKVVHHAILYLDYTGEARKKDAETPEPGYRTFGGPGILPTGALGGWAPGATMPFLPDGVGRMIRKGSDLVLQIHYHPSGKEEKDQSTVGLFFTKKPAEKIVGGIGVRGRLLYIPAGAKRHHVSGESEPLPVDATALAVFPHMHYIGREMVTVAHLPDGKTLPLITIKDWDFNWQGAYYYEKPVRLPKGTVIKLDAWYDNSADNPLNPSNPPKSVRWGEQTTDEMCLCGVQVITDTRADLLSLMTMRGNGLGALLGGGVNAETLRGGADAKNDVPLPPGGVPIPAEHKELLGRFDKNGDGKLSAEEIEGMPALLRDRVKQAIRERLGGKPQKP